MSLWASTRASIRHALNTANEMIEQLETEKIQIMLGMIDQEKEREAYQKILEWCRKVKETREPLTYQQKRDFLRLLGLTVEIKKQDTRQEEIAYGIKVRMPEIQALISQDLDTKNHCRI